jgi:hypothetical protein
MSLTLLLFILFSSAVSAASSVVIVYASGPEWDCDQNYSDIPGACECWHDGYTDGNTTESTAIAFNNTKNDECRDKGNQYEAGFNAAEAAAASTANTQS